MMRPNECPGATVADQRVVRFRLPTETRPGLHKITVQSAKSYRDLGPAFSPSMG